MHMSAEQIEKHYSNGELTVVWRPSRCMHAKRCWKELPSVFEPAKRPWVTITGATSAEITAQVQRCPSGALSLLADEAVPSSERAAVAVEPPRAVGAPVYATTPVSDAMTVTRDLLIHRLHEAAELEHDVMCTYLYAAFSLRQGGNEGLTPAQDEATARWRRAILAVAVEEMGHLAAVWNITSALGGSPRFGRANFPSDPGLLPASVVMKLAPFDEATIQHFVHLERPKESPEPDGAGFVPELPFVRGATRDGLTPMAVDYETVGALYASIENNLRVFAEAHGEEVAFSGDPALQLSQDEVGLDAVIPVTSLESALAALASIVEQGEGTQSDSENCHFARFAKIRDELTALRAENPDFQPAFPAATNPALRRPLRADNRVWIEHEDAAKTVDLANAGYALMLRLLSYSYLVPRSSGEKRLVVGLAIELMRAVTLLGERAARLPAGPSNPTCNAGMSFTTLRDSAPLPPGLAARFYFMERFEEIAATSAALDASDPRAAGAARIMASLAKRASRGFGGLT
jgi:uncharacterized Fe-S cluster protein YjdI